MRFLSLTLPRFLLFALLLTAATAVGGRPAVILADSASRRPMANASVFNRKSTLVGLTRKDGRLPYLSPADFPATIRFMGYKERVIDSISADTIFMQENATELPEVVFESKQHKVLHMLAYVREYSTLSTYTDTVFLFREKMVDFMLPNQNVRFKGWTTPRVLASKSYYRFTNSLGLDSVSDRCNQHFSWADWVGIAPAARIPSRLLRSDHATDTLRGKYSPTETWIRNADRLLLDVNVLADTTSRKWVPNLSTFFRHDIDFEQFRIRFNYSDITADSISPVDLTGYSFNVESNGRGHRMFMFNRRDEPFFVTTYAEVYVVDKEYITVKEAKKWERRRTDSNDITIYEPAEAPALQASVSHLIERVNSVDHDKTRLTLEPDRRLVSRNIVKLNFGQSILKRIKGIFGIDEINAKRKRKKEWRQFRIDQMKKNNSSRKNREPVEDRQE